VNALKTLPAGVNESNRLVSTINVPLARQRVRWSTVRTNADGANPIFLIQSAVGLMNAPKVSDCVYEEQHRYIAFPSTTRPHPLVRSESAALSFCPVSGICPIQGGNRLHRSSPLAHNASSERYCDRAHRKGLTLLVTTPSLNGDVVPIALFLPLLMRQAERSTTTTCHRLMTNIPVGCRTDLKAGSSWSRRAALQTATAKLDSTLGMAHDSFQCKIRDR
jgi:hypothetical protein